MKTIAYVASVLNQPTFLAERRHFDPAYDPFDHIALDFDFDGFVTTPIDTSQLALLTAALRQAANTGDITFTDMRFRKNAGGNLCRIFARETLSCSAAAKLPAHHANEALHCLQQVHLRSFP